MEQSNFSSNPGNDSKKKILLWILIALTALSVVFFFGFYFKKNLETHKAENQPATQEKHDQDKLEALSAMLPQVECSFGNDQEAYAKAVESANINVCDCVKKEDLKETCKKTAFDLNAYLEAIKQYNPDLCNEIENNSRKRACLKLTASGVDHLKKEDPQYLASIYVQSHNGKAIEELEKLIQKDANNVDNLISLALAYAEKGLKEQEQGRSQTPYVEKALVIIEKAKNLDSNNAEVYRAEGYIYEIKPEIIKAVDIYGKAIKLNANNVLAYVGRGHAARILGYLDRALEDFKKAASMDAKKEYDFIYINLCSLQNSMNLFDEAIKNCKIVTELEKTDVISKSNAYQILGDLYAKSGDYSQAENHILSAKNLTPNEPNVYTTLADLNIKQKKYQEAEKQASAAVTLSPTKATAYLKLATAVYMQERYADAIKISERGLILADTDVSLLDSSKKAVKKDICYVLAFSYKRIGDEVNSKKYEDLAKLLEKN